MMDKLKWASEVMDRNLDEAMRYAMKAHEMHEHCRAAADWCVEMAKAHMQFNTAGRGVMDHLMERFADDPINAGIAPGVTLVYKDKMADRIKKVSEIQAILSMYK